MVETPPLFQMATQQREGKESDRHWGRTGRADWGNVLNKGKTRKGRKRRSERPVKEGENKGKMLILTILYFEISHTRPFLPWSVLHASHWLVILFGRTGGAGLCHGTVRIHISWGYNS